MNKRTFVFLDIDGVLNLSSQWGRMYRLHDCCVKNFGEYIQSIGTQNCRIVLTSSWKNGWNYKGSHSRPILDLLQKLQPYGIRFFGKTESNAEDDRAKEINEYILSHKLQDVPCIVIDDDRSLFHSKLLPNCKMLHVDASKGFQPHQESKKWYEHFNVIRQKFPSS